MKLSDLRLVEFGLFNTGLILGLFFLFQLYPILFTFNSYLEISQVILYVLLLVIFLFDYAYFLLRIDYSRTPVELLIDIVVLILLLSIPYSIENTINPTLSILIIVLLSFIFSIIKYNLALKRLTNKKIIHFATNKRNLDCCGAISFAVFIIIALFTTTLNLLFIVLIILEIIGFIVYSSVKKDFFV